MPGSLSEWGYGFAGLFVVGWGVILQKKKTDLGHRATFLGLMGGIPLAQNGYFLATRAN